MIAPLHVSRPGFGLMMLLAIGILAAKIATAQAEPEKSASPVVVDSMTRLNSLEGQDDYFAVMKELSIPNRRDLPQLFVSGDSISQHYAPALKASLRGKINVTHWMDLPERYPQDVPKTPYSGTSQLLLEMLNSVLDSKEYHPRYLLLNAGLHDATYQYSPDLHRANLMKIIDLVNRHEAKMIWVTTTPREKRNPHNPLIDAYNVVALDVMRDHDISVIDLNKLAKELIAKEGEKTTFNGDGLHFSFPTRNKMGQFIAEELIQILENELLAEKNSSLRN